MFVYQWPLGITVLMPQHNARKPVTVTRLNLQWFYSAKFFFQLE